MNADLRIASSYGGSNNVSCLLSLSAQPGYVFYWEFKFTEEDTAGKLCKIAICAFLIQSKDGRGIVKI